MGGNALKEPSIRVDKETFRKVWGVLQATTSKLGFTKVDLVKSYSEKDSFGDMDILVSTPQGEWPEDFLESSFLKNREIVRNGPVTSIGYDLVQGRFQIDFILVKDSEFDSAYNYFAFNDLGNLLGIIAKSLGFRLGHKGLIHTSYDVDNFDQVRFKTLVSQDWDLILKFLGYKPEEYAKGFKTPLDIFNFVSSGEYFHPELYLLENRNSVSRIRDAKRVIYRQFLEYVSYFVRLDKVEINKFEVLEKAFDVFPEFHNTLYSNSIEYLRERDLRALTGGKRVGQVTGLTGIPLGEFMKVFKEIPIERNKTTEENSEYIKGYITGAFNCWKRING